MVFLFFLFFSLPRRSLEASRTSLRLFGLLFFQNAQRGAFQEQVSDEALVKIIERLGNATQTEERTGKVTVRLCCARTSCVFRVRGFCMFAPGVRVSFSDQETTL